MFTIIIPVYNAEQHLRRCVDSIIAQTYKEWEMILVDDGSADSSGTICDEYAAQDCRIRAVHQKNAGPSAARNHGLDLAKGDYISFIDADDWVETNLYEEYAKAIESTSYDIVFQGFVREHDAERKENSFAIDTSTVIESKEDIVCKLYKGNVFGWAWCKIFKREVIETYHLQFDESLTLWEDELFTIQFMKHATSVRSLDCHLYHYIYYTGSLMNTRNTPLRRLALAEIMNENLKEIANQELNVYVNDIYNRNLKFDMLMALMEKPTHTCDTEKKRELIHKYYQRCKKYPTLRWHNALKNRISYAIAEGILLTHSPKLIISLFRKLG